ncbi:unnamed protein product [Callosobruchus maculatus]|uniref:CCHC-type domain-containing protein n=1 Tax=Callosobruchus maculatus TaxID=64391 RepID=A0A653CSF0_CALMS|nr:unnamed protein product [Callosobruchus maculatus]
MLQQTTVSQRQEERPCYTVMTDTPKIVPTFDGEGGPNAAKVWLQQVETSSQLYGWPEPHTYQIAVNCLKGAAYHWLLSRITEVTDWRTFKTAFKKTFLFQVNRTEAWTRMVQRVQKYKENVNTYFHEKVCLCRTVELPFSEVKEQVVVGLRSKDLSNFLISRTHTDEDELYQDIVSYSRIESARKEKVRDTDSEKREEKYKAPISTATARDAPKCYNCGLGGHWVSQCPKPPRPRGSCFTCGSTEHQKRDCPVKREPAVKESTLLVEDKPVSAFVLQS